MTFYYGDKKNKIINLLVTLRQAQSDKGITLKVSSH
ncbi:MAG: hypothetical protein BWY38_01429 [Ignavibacteria bacterium ADurb.Bin266]|jgi:hypothetical protein|nr:MAG: hypothetical protein BWY38_01429 [Ignavibacteria bacterium ADurb.Bin266]